jgi:hypothetical protein
VDLVELSSPAFAWDFFFDRALQWGIGPAVAFNLRSSFSEVLTNDVLARVEEIEARSRGAALSLALLAVDVIKSAEARGIPCLLLKGAALGAFAYGDPSLRTHSDIDLLVRPDDTKAMRKSLEARGFVREYPKNMEETLLRAGHALELSRGGVKVEIHSTLMSKHLHIDLPIDEVWRDRITLTCVNHEVRALSPSHLVMYLAVHAAKHEWASLRLLCDLVQLGNCLSEVDRLRAIRLGQSIHARRIMAITDELLTFFFDEPLFDPLDRPAARTDYGSDSGSKPIALAVSRALRRLGVQQNHSADPSLFFFHDPRLSQLLFWTSLRERVRDKIACFASLALHRRWKPRQSNMILSGDDRILS